MQENRIPNLSVGAVRGLARANLGGPNCSPAGDLRPLLKQTRSMSLKEIAVLFGEMGPDTFLASYAVQNNKYSLGSADIAEAYCFDHMSMVKSAEKIFFERGFEDDYFRQMRENRFVVTPENLPEYLFSCLGKIGKIVERGRNWVMIDYFYFDHGSFGRNTIERDIAISLYGVVLPDDACEGDYVAVHFASAFLCNLEFPRSISSGQVTDNNLLKLLKTLSRGKKTVKIDYHNVFSRDLTEWTQKRLSPKS